jgi:hypothetical protein
LRGCRPSRRVKWLRSIRCLRLGRSVARARGDRVGVGSPWCRRARLLLRLLLLLMVRCGARLRRWARVSRRPAWPPPPSAVAEPTTGRGNISSRSRRGGRRVVRAVSVHRGRRGRRRGCYGCCGSVASGGGRRRARVEVVGLHRARRPRRRIRDAPIPDRGGPCRRRTLRHRLSWRRLGRRRRRHSLRRGSRRRGHRRGRRRRRRTPGRRTNRPRRLGRGWLRQCLFCQRGRRLRPSLRVARTRACSLEASGLAGGLARCLACGLARCLARCLARRLAHPRLLLRRPRPLANRKRPRRPSAHRRVFARLWQRYGRLDRQRTGRGPARRRT